MASNVTLQLNEDNDEDILVTVTTNVPVAGTVFDLTGLTVEAYLKTTAATSDTDVTTWKGSTATGEIDLTDAPNGKATISIPAASLIPAKTWLRCDVVASGKRKTVFYGPVIVTVM